MDFNKLTIKSQEAVAAASDEYAPGEILVKYTPTARGATRARASSAETSERIVRASRARIKAAAWPM